MKVPVTFIYGEHDWMNPQTGKDCCTAIEATRGRLNPDDLKVGISFLAGDLGLDDQEPGFLTCIG